VTLNMLEDLDDFQKQIHSEAHSHEHTH
jgi:hypothetical protein